MIVVVPGILRDKPVTKDVHQINRVRITVEHAEKLLDVLQRGSLGLEGLFELDYLESDASNLLEELLVAGGQGGLLLDVDAAELVEELVFLITLHYAEEDVELNKVGNTKQMELSPPEKQTKRLLFCLTLKVF